MRFKFTLYIVLTLLLGGCSGLSLSDSQGGWRSSDEKPVLEIPVSELRKQSPYTLASEDVLLIHAWGIPEFGSPSSLSSSLRTPSSGSGRAAVGVTGINAVIHGDGTIDLPLIGSINVDGDTVEQARQRIAGALSKYVIKPKVGVIVLEYNSRKILVLGEVKSPGIVVNPGPNLSLVEALAQSGSIDNLTANRSHVYVIRGVMGEPRISLVDLHTAVGMFNAQHVWLKRRDVVYVDSQLITDWNRFVSQLLPTVASAYLFQRTPIR